jgi:chromosome segregation ATPase
MWRNIEKVMKGQLLERIEELTSLVERCINKIDTLKKDIHILTLEKERLTKELNQRTTIKEDLQQAKMPVESEYESVRGDKKKLRQIREEVAKCIEEIEVNMNKKR